MKVPISAIGGLDAYRKNVGDVTGLAASIKKDGLLNPIILTKDDRLVSGARRIVAAIHNGSTVIDAIVVKDRTDVMEALESEKANGSDINALPMVLSEMARQGEIIALLPKRDGIKHQGFLLRERLAAYFDQPRQSLRRALVVTRASDDPSATAHVKEICAQMDSTGLIGSTIRRLAQAGIGVPNTHTPTIDSLPEQRVALTGAAVKLEALSAILPRIQDINSRMSQEDIAEYIRILAAGRTVLTQTLTKLRKAQK